MKAEHPPSAEIASLSPTSFEILRACRLRVSFGQQPSRGGRFQGTPATRLGTVCHNVLDKAVREGLLHDESWRKRVEQLWDAAITVELERARSAGVVDTAAKWPGYQLKRARLFRVAGRVREFLRGLPPGAQVVTEEPLSADAGLLRGRPDLIIRSGERHQIIDYKSGGVLDRETDLPRDAYVRQLQLYAYLEHAATGSWPLTAHLFPLHGAPVEIDIDPAACSALAREALDALRDYNGTAPGAQPASPASATCAWCPAATVCSAFWDACDATWAPTVQAAAGIVTSAFATKLGGVTIHVDATAGSVGATTIVIKNIDPEAFEQAADVAVGDEVAATCLIADERGAGFWISAAGSFSATRKGRSAEGMA